MNILIIGNGGREHALAWKIKQSSLCDKLFVAPGNAGTALLAENIAITGEDFDKISDFCLAHRIDLLVVGPEGPLVKGIRDYFESNHAFKDLLIVGPGKMGAQLEGSKDFSKQFMLRHHIPTAKARTFTHPELQEAISYLDSCEPPIVLKADGLAAGKGVIICQGVPEAKEALVEMLENKKFGEASTKVLIEEFLDGIELSVFILTDGTDFIILPEAKDYKRVGDHDLGPNTGGMGSVSPVPFADKNFMNKVEHQVIVPTINGLKKEAIPFKGFIFVGLMNVNGDPFVIEYNTRMGDPETQSVIPRIKDDLVPILVACAKGDLKNQHIQIDDDYTLSIVMVAGGYPDLYEKGKVISGLNQHGKSLIFQAGTKQTDGQVVTDGGRVLAVTGKAASLKEARDAAYNTLQSISWEGAHHRNDIGMDLLEYLK